MTVVEIMQLAWRRWYIYALVIIIAVVTAVTFNTGKREYIVKTEFAMSAPGTSINFEPPGDTNSTLVTFADVVVRQLNAREPTSILSSPSASLFGNGIRAGISVSLANTGSQWNSSFGRPVIIVQLIGPSESDVLQQLNSINSKIVNITREIQRESGAKPVSWITVDADLSDVNVGSFGPTRSGLLKSRVALVASALCLATIMAASVEKISRRRQISKTSADSMSKSTKIRSESETA